MLDYFLERRRAALRVRLAPSTEFVPLRGYSESTRRGYSESTRRGPPRAPLNVRTLEYPQGYLSEYSQRVPLEYPSGVRRVSTPQEYPV